MDPVALWHDLVMIGTGLVIAAYGYVQCQDEAWDTGTADDDAGADDDWDGSE